MSNKFVPENPSSVLTNPAMEFLSEDTIKKIDNEQDTTEEIKPKKDSETRKAKPTVRNTTEKPIQTNISLKDVPEGYRINPAFIEKRSKKFCLYMRPSIHAKLKEKLAKDRIPINEYINSLIEKDIEK